MFLLSPLIDLLFPSTCLNCGCRGKFLCPDCSRLLEPVNSFICPVCCRPSPYGMTHPGCRTRYTPDGLIAVFHYHSPIRQYLKKLKYRPWIKTATDEVVEYAVQIIKSNPEKFTILNQKLLITFVPLHWRRRHKRGYNQSQLIAQSFARKFNICFAGKLLVRTRSTKAQFGLKKQERQKNIKSAFSMAHISNHSQLSGQISSFGSDPPRILLIDDIWTTGATTRECVRVLKKGFPLAKVYILVLAR